MILLGGALACAPHVRIEWSTAPDLPVTEALATWAVVDRAGSVPLREALEATLGRRLRLGCDEGAAAVVTLERVDAEESVDDLTDDQGVIRFVAPGVDQAVELTPQVWTEWQGRVHLGWTVARCDGGLVEEIERATVASSRADPGRGDPARFDGLLDELVRGAGHALGRRLVPSSGAVSRRWFRVGDPRLRLAATAVRVGHWDAAAATWHEIVTDPRSAARARGRALHDLAVRHEVAGRYPQAWQAIRAAERATAAPAILRYRQALERTWAEVRSLRPYAPLDEEADP